MQTPAEQYIPCRKKEREIIAYLALTERQSVLKEQISPTRPLPENKVAASLEAPETAACMNISVVGFTQPRAVWKKVPGGHCAISRRPSAPQRRKETSACLRELKTERARGTRTWTRGGKTGGGLHCL